jgi:hypothetical protein
MAFGLSLKLGAFELGTISPAAPGTALRYGKNVTNVKLTDRARQGSCA